MLTVKKILPVCLLLLAAYPALTLDTAINRIPDDSALRTGLRETWFMESPGRVLGKPSALYRLDGGGRVEVRVEESKDEFGVVLARELNGNSGYFPGWAQGSWILTRRKDTGAAGRIRIFLRSDYHTYVQFRPFSDDKCLMDVVVYDAYLAAAVTLPVSLERVYTMPLSEIMDLAGSKFPRRYFEPHPVDYRDQRLLAEKVRERLAGLQFADDGAIDQEGRYVYIETGAEQTGTPGLNCSGFTKWLIDGMLRPVTGERLAITPLKAPFGDRGSTFTEAWEESRDPFFGLDWIRNLAARAGTALRSSAHAGLREIEVRQEPFSQLIVRADTGTTAQSYRGFLENAGYDIEGLLPLLYTLAIDEPGKLYLAAVNDEVGPPSTEANPRGRPRMRQYFHVAALLPSFNENGVFQVAVFESAAETSFKKFRSRYPDHYYVSLVRVPVIPTFDP